MSVVTLSEVCKSYGYQDVLTGVSFFVTPGRKVGLIGANGAGKSTVLRLITGEETSDAGRVVVQANTLIGLLSQEPLLGDARTILEAAQRPTPELQRVWAELTALETQALEDEAALARYDDLHHQYQDLGGYECENRAKEVLVGLGFSEAAWDKAVSVLSGGERTRLALAQILVRQPDLLLLDEPTNHIDWQIAEWLQEYLQRYPGAALMVSHDRYFLDAVAEEIVELENGRAKVYTGNYSAYVKKKAFEREQAEEAHRRTTEEIERQQAVIQRLRSQRKFNSMHSRERVVEKLQQELGDVPRESRRDMKIHQRDVATSGREVLTVRSLRFGFDERPLFQNVSMDLVRGDRLAIIGPNGAGKTTLLKVLAGELKAQGGAVTYGYRVKPAYFAQDLSILDPEATVYETIWDTGATDHPQTMQALHQFLFKGDEIYKQVGDLSGGERTRLALCRLLVQRPNLLLLDEPTNHLDIASREAVERALREYPGTLITVSHDRYFLEAVATRLLDLRPEGHQFYDGTYSHYREKQRVSAPAPSRAATRAAEPARPASTAKAASAPAPKARRVSPARRLPKLEAEIATAESRLKEVTEALGSSAAWGDGSDPMALTAEYNQLTASLEALYQEWEEVAAQASNT